MRVLYEILRNEGFLKIKMRRKKEKEKKKRTKEKTVASILFISA